MNIFMHIQQLVNFITEKNLLEKHFKYSHYVKILQILFFQVYICKSYFNLLLALYLLLHY